LLKQATEFVTEVAAKGGVDPLRRDEKSGPRLDPGVGGECGMPYVTGAG